jgi:TonB family protein
LILLSLYLLRDKNVQLLRAIAIIGFLKLLAPPVFFSQTVQSMEIVQQLPAVIISPAVASPAQPTAVQITTQSLLFLIWVTISLSFILTAIIRVGSLFLLKKSATPLPTPKDLRNGSLPLIQLYSTDKISSPMIFGILKYNLLVPISWKHMPHTMQRAIIHHEIAHLRQKDQLIGVLQMLGVALNFFNPLVWILNHHLNEFCEKACDDRALIHSNLQPKQYLNSLVTMAELSAGKNDLYTPALAFTKSYKSLKSRIMHQAKRQYNNLNFTPLNYGLLAVVVAGMIAFSCDFIVDTQDQPVPPLPASSELESPSENPAVKFVPYDTPPQIVGGMSSLRDNITYPEPALSAGVEGTVIVQAFINKEGVVDEVVVVKGIPRTGLNEAAIEAVSQTRFEPALQKGTAVGVWYSIPITFRIRSNAHSLEIYLDSKDNLTLNGTQVTIEELRQQIVSLDPNAGKPVIISGHSEVDMALVNKIHKQLIASDHLQITYRVRS